MFGLQTLKANPRRLLVIVAMVVLVGFSAACQPADTYEGESSSPAEASLASDTSAASALDEDPSTSPLLDLAGVSLGSDESVYDYYNSQYDEAEIAIAECMIKNGFEYVPFDYSQIQINEEPFDQSREYAEDYGFGVTAFDDPARDLLPGQIATDPALEVIDPNEDYFFSLSKGERDSYQATLYGNAEAGVTGCQTEAFDEAFAAFIVFSDFGFNYSELEELIRSDPRLLETEEQWQACMANAGYSFADTNAAEASIVRDLQAIGTAHGVEPGDALSKGLAEDIAALAEKERTIAVAAWDCDGPKRELEQVVTREYEQRFVDEHGVEVRRTLGS